MFVNFVFLFFQLIHPGKPKTFKQLRSRLIPHQEQQFMNKKVSFIKTDSQSINCVSAMAGRIKQDEQLVITFNSRNCMVMKVGEGGWVFFCDNNPRDFVFL